MSTRRFLTALFAFLLSLTAGYAANDRELVFVEYNVENLFDCVHDSLKDDLQYLPDGPLKWNSSCYWWKLNAIARAITSCSVPSYGLQGRNTVLEGTQRDVSDDASDSFSPSLSQDYILPPADMILLCEVENDSCCHALTRRSLLRGAGYEYIVSNSPDVRGIDVALLYSPLTVKIISTDFIRVKTLPDMRPTRDILYAKAVYSSADTIHVFGVHAPSRTGGERATREFRMQVARTLTSKTDSILAENPDARIIVAGDFNDYCDSPSVEYITAHGLTDVSANVEGIHRDKANAKHPLARATYRYRGEWNSLDHIFLSHSMRINDVDCFVNDNPMLLEEDEKYGGYMPRRFVKGVVRRNGFSDHLPLVCRIRM